LPSVRALFFGADDVWWGLSEQDWLQAFAAHPRIGAQKAAGQTAQSQAWSVSEQRGMDRAGASVKERLAEGNDAYFEKFGFVFLIYAHGKSAEFMLDTLQTRLQNDRATEIENAAREQAKITRRRMEAWLLAQLGA
jgi:OHCU decarboxylase